MESDDALLATDIISYLQSVIGEGNTSELEETLTLIDFENMEFAEAVQLIILLLKNAQIVNSVETANLIYKYNEKFYPSNTPIQFMTILFLEPRCDVELLGFLVNVVKIDFNFIDIVYELIQINPIDPDNYNSSQLRLAFNRCYNVFSHPSVDTLEKLYAVAKNVNDDLADEIAFKIRQVGKYAEIPEWMIGTSTDMSILSALPKESAVVIPDRKRYPGLEALAPSKDLIESMMEHIDDELVINSDCDQPLDNEDIKNILLANYNALSLPQKYDLAKEFVEIRDAAAMSDDVTLFITLGPSCPFVGATLEELDYGGARMFTFNQFEYDEDVDDFDIDEDLHPSIQKDWFKGYCMQCNLRIRRRWHSVRKPQKYGGWFGCFCSWDCTKNNIIDFNAADPVLLNLCDIYETEMYNYGILDRIPDAEYPKYLSEVLNQNKHLSLSETVNLSLVTGNSELQELIQPVEIKERAPLVTVYYYYSENEEVTKTFMSQLEQLVDYTPFPDGTLGSPVNIIKIDVDTPVFDEELHQSHNVESVPTTVVYYQGTPKAKFVGNQIRPIVDLVNSLLN